MVGVLLLFLSASDGVFSKEQDLWRPGTSEEGTHVSGSWGGPPVGLLSTQARKLALGAKPLTTTGSPLRCAFGNSLQQVKLRTLLKP